jgi:hypothetical protein
VPRGAGFFTIAFMKPFARGPGLAKTHQPPLVHVRTVSLVAGSDARWKELFDGADVVSEGAPRGDDPGRRYFGSTHILLLIHPERPGQSMGELAEIVARDPHVRLRAMRLARREAAQRAEGPLDCVRSEIRVSHSAMGVNIHVEVEARVFPDRRAAPRRKAASDDA